MLRGYLKDILDKIRKIYTKDKIWQLQYIMTKIVI